MTMWDVDEQALNDLKLTKQPQRTIEEESHANPFLNFINDISIQTKREQRKNTQNKTHTHSHLNTRTKQTYYRHEFNDDKKQKRNNENLPNQ